MAAPNLSAEDVTQAAPSHLPSPPSPPAAMEFLPDQISPRISAMNLWLDQVAMSQQSSNAAPPSLLRLFEPDNIAADLAAMVDFAKSDWQLCLNWRDCTAHKNVISHLDLSNPKQALVKMLLERSDSSARPAQGTHTNLFHSQLADVVNQQSRPVTSKSPIRLGSPCPLPTPAPSPRSGSAQEHLAQSRMYVLQGHMPQLAPQAASASRDRPRPSDLPRNGIAAPNATIDYREGQPFGTTNMYSRFYGGPYASPGGHVPYNRGQVVTSGPGQLMQQQNQLQPTQFSPNHVTASPLVPNPQSNNAIKQNNEAAKVPGQHVQHPPKLYMPSNLSSPYSRQLNPQARLRAEQLATEHAERLQAQGIKITRSPEKKRATSRSPKTSFREAPPQGAKDPGSGTATPQPPPAPVYKTPEQIKYEQELAQYRAYKLEQEKQERLKAERKAKLKEELDAAMRIPGNDVLAYRYRDYMEIYPCAAGARLSTYHLRLLANQAIEDNDRSDEAMAVRHAKEKWWNFWEVGDRQMVVELLREKRKTCGDVLRANMKAGGHLITYTDIEAIRRSVRPENRTGVEIGRFEEWEARRL